MATSAKRPKRDTQVSRVGKVSAVKKAPSGVVDGFQMAELAEYLANVAVTELTIVEVSKGTYQLEGLLSWKPRRCVLVVARGGVRTFRSVDTLVRFCKEIGVGKTSIRLELKT